MIRPDTRSRLTAADLDVVLLALSGGSAARRTELDRQLAAEGPDALLDAAELPGRLAALRGVAIPSERLFLYVTVRHALRQAGFDDSELADYLAALVIDFGHRDRACRVDWNDDERHRYLVDILADIDACDGERRFRVMAHLGNYALWLSGLFPDYIAARRLRRGGPDLPYYDAMGRRGFGMASDHALAGHYGLDGVFRAAADRFPALRSALNGLSDRVFFPGHLSPDRMLRELGIH